MKLPIYDEGLEACKERGIERGILLDGSKVDVYSNLNSPNSQGRYLVLESFSVSLLDGDHIPIVKAIFHGGKITYVRSNRLPEWFDLEVVHQSAVGAAETKAIEQVVRLYAFDTEDVQRVLEQFDNGQFVRTRVPEDYGRIVSVRGPVLRVRYPEPWTSPVTWKPVQETDFDMTRKVWQGLVEPISEEDVPEATLSKLK